MAGLGATYLTGERVWAASGAVLGSVIPLTLVIIMPVNNALKQGLKKIGSEVQVGSHHHHRHFRPHNHEHQDLHQRAWDTEVNDQEDDEEDMELSASSIMWSLCFGSVCIRGSVLGQAGTVEGSLPTDQHDDVEHAVPVAVMHALGRCLRSSLMPRCAW